MQTQPRDLSVEALSTVLVAGWQIVAESIEYAPVGFGSHHWFVVDRSGQRWFLTADAVGNDPVRLAGLRAALCTAATLRREAGLNLRRGADSAEGRRAAGAGRSLCRCGVPAPGRGP